MTYRVSGLACYSLNTSVNECNAVFRWYHTTALCQAKDFNVNKINFYAGFRVLLRTVLPNFCIHCYVFILSNVSCYLEV